MKQTAREYIENLRQSFPDREEAKKRALLDIRKPRSVVAALACDAMFDMLWRIQSKHASIPISPKEWEEYVCKRIGNLNADQIEKLGDIYHGIANWMRKHCSPGTKFSKANVPSGVIRHLAKDSMKLVQKAA